MVDRRCGWRSSCLRVSIAGIVAIVAGCGDNITPAASCTDPTQCAAPQDAADHDVGEIDSADAADLISARPIAPLSTAMVTSQRPTLRWELSPGTDGARVELCRDRACTMSIATLDVTGTSIAPSADLPHGPVYWRLHGRAGSEVGADASATWELFVGVSSAPVDTSWGTTLDVNGDGLGDVVVGAPGVDSQSGRAYVYLGSAAGLAAAPATTLIPPDAGGIFGNSIASAGDVNGDGYADVIVGAPGNYDSDHTGRAYIYLGGPDGLAASPEATLVGPDGPGGDFGWQVTFAGDDNGDGYADVAVSAPSGASSAGAVYMYLGGPGGTSTTFATSLAGPDGTGGWFGRALASVGDLDGDGHEKLAVASTSHLYIYGGGAPKQLPAPTSAEPRVLAGADFNGDGYADLVDDLSIYPGGASGVSDTPSTSVWGPYANDGPVAAAGDVNGDGYADLAVGSPEAWCDSNLDPCGAVFVFLGGPSGLSTAYTWIYDPPFTFFDNFGESVAGAGDVDGDGYDDIVACSADNNGSTGYLAMFAGSAAGISTTSAQVCVGPDGYNGLFGVSVY